MKVDLYTKAILTVIAFSLVWLCVKADPRPVKADEIQNVRVVGIVPVGIYGTRGDLSNPMYPKWDMSRPIPVTEVPPKQPTR